MYTGHTKKDQDLDRYKNETGEKYSSILILLLLTNI